MILINCPNCGPRNSQEFRFGGELNPRPGSPLNSSDEAWVSYIYMRENNKGEQIEWWYHRSGCGRWFLAQRDTYTNVISKTYWWSPNEGD